MEDLLAGIIENTVDVHLDCPDVSIYFEKLSNLVMILHEMITNSVKHAWNRNDEKRTFLTITESHKEALTILYSDNGRKLQSVSEIKPRFGMELISILLGSSLKHENNLSIHGGLEYKFNLKIS